MSTPTAATIFSGGGGADIGLSQAGYDVRWGIEYDDAIASVARQNGLPVQTGNVLDVDPKTLGRVDLLHMSPPCPNFSVAKTGATETEDDLALAEACAQFVRTLAPRAVTMENVWGYRKSQSWQIIRKALTRCGYTWNAWHLNAADYGVPQTRKRMIVVAVKGSNLPRRPAPTHAEAPSRGGFFDARTAKWVGWMQAIEDLIPSLPDSELADWQKKRMPENVSTALAHGTEQRNYNPSPPNAPAPTVKASDFRGFHRALLISTGNKNKAQAKSGKGVLSPHTPSATVGASDGLDARAVLIGGVNTSDVQCAPGVGISASMEPARCVNTSNSLQWRATEGRKVVQMTPRCLARFQTFPDWYELPDTKSLACRIIGNAVPPLLMQRIAESVTLPTDA